MVRKLKDSRATGLQCFYIIHNVYGFSGLYCSDQLRMRARDGETAYTIDCDVTILSSGLQFIESLSLLLVRSV